MCQSTQDYKGAELEDDPFEGEEVGACGKVQELEGDGEVGSSNQEIARLLAPENVLNIPKAVPIAVAS